MWQLYTTTNFNCTDSRNLMTCADRNHNTGNKWDAQYYLSISKASITSKSSRNNETVMNALDPVGEIICLM